MIIRLWVFPSMASRGVWLLILYEHIFQRIIKCTRLRYFRWLSPFLSIFLKSLIVSSLITSFKSCLNTSTGVFWNWFIVTYKTEHRLSVLMLLSLQSDKFQTEGYRIVFSDRFSPQDLSTKLTTTSITVSFSKVDDDVRIYRCFKSDFSRQWLNEMLIKNDVKALFVQSRIGIWYIIHGTLVL